MALTILSVRVLLLVLPTTLFFFVALTVLIVRVLLLSLPIVVGPILLLTPLTLLTGRPGRTEVVPGRCVFGVF